MRNKVENNFIRDAYSKKINSLNENKVVSTKIKHWGVLLLLGKIFLIKIHS